jgi:hypothetical protein
MKYLAWICLTVMVHQAVAQQKQTAHIQQVWFGYVNQTRLSDHWGLWLDLHLRSKEDFVNDLSTSIVRPGISYYANDRLRFTAGYAYVNFFPRMITVVCRNLNTGLGSRFTGQYRENVQGW